MAIVQTYRTASLKKRLLAWFLDAFLVFIVQAVILYLIFGSQLTLISENYVEEIISFEQMVDQFTLLASSSDYTTMQFYFFTVVLLYYVVAAYFMQGATLGKKMCGIAIIGENGKTPTFSSLTFREFLIKYVAAQFSCHIISIVSLIMMITREDKLTIHDLLAKTRVVETDTMNQIII